MNVSGVEDTGHSVHPHKHAPYFPDRVRRLVHLRDVEGKTFAAIAKEMGGTRMNACYAYHRWRDWVYKEKVQ